MQDTELFLSLAEIAGVFVGFGALIAVRSGTTASAIEVASIGMVVLFAVVVVAVALVPVVISRFGVTGHGLWLAAASSPCSAASARRCCGSGSRARCRTSWPRERR